MKKHFLGGLAALTLALASCGGPITTPPEANKPTPAQPGTIADVPEDSTAAREFLFTKNQSRAVMRSLGLSPQDSVDLGDRLRVVLTVNRAKSGQNIGKKKASAVLIWGNQTVKLEGAVTVGLGHAGETRALKTAGGEVTLEVERPNFQDKLTKSTAYVEDTGPMCARFAFNLGTANGAQTFSATSPVEVCEGDREKDAERVALEKFSKGLMYTHESEGAARWTFSRAPLSFGPREFREMLGVGPEVVVTIQNLPEFFAPLRQDAKGNDTGYTNLERQFAAYYTRASVYRAQVTPSREEIFVIGDNGWGSSGLRTRRFGAASAPATGVPSLENATVSATFAGYGGVLTREVQVLNAPADAQIYAEAFTRNQDYCEPIPESEFQRYKGYMPETTPSTLSDGTPVVTLAEYSRQDRGENLVMGYEVHIWHNGAERVVKGHACYIPRPLSLEGVGHYPDFYTDLGTGMTEAWLYLGELPRGATATATYRFDDSPECGPGSSTLRTSGSYALIDQGTNSSGDGWIDLQVPGTLTGAGSSTAMFYTLTVTGPDGQTATINDFGCHYDD